MVKSKIEKIKVTKIEVAKRMFIEAVILFFEKRDPISIHHLLHASHEILSKKTGKHFIGDEKYFTEEGRKVFKQAFVKSKNFIKHADRDPDGVLDFNPSINKTMLLDCALMLYGHLGADFFPGLMYITWMAVESPNLFLDDILPQIKMIKEAGFNPDDFENLVICLKYWVNNIDPKNPN